VTRNTRLIAVAATVVIVAAFAAIYIVSGGAPISRGIEPILVSASPGPIIAPIASALPDVPSPTVPPTNTALPLPSGVGGILFTSAPSVSPPPPPRSATPTPDAAVWRFEGRVVDDTGASLGDVCVVIGPRGCQRFSPHTDDRGVYFFDVPQIPTVVYDLYFEKDGFVTVWYRTQPTSPTTFNVVLHRTTSRSAVGPSDG
jgi:hypothetical protein